MQYHGEKLQKNTYTLIFESDPRLKVHLNSFRKVETVVFQQVFVIHIVINRTFVTHYGSMLTENYLHHN